MMTFKLGMAGCISFFLFILYNILNKSEKEEDLMPEYYVSSISLNDASAMADVETLLAGEGIRRDPCLDYCCGIYDDHAHLIATGSSFDNTLRCFAVSHEHRGEGLLNLILTHLLSVQVEHGNTHLFLYTKSSSAIFFHDAGFYEIARIDENLVFMENTRTGFSSYLSSLEKTKKDGKKIAAIVMNANPFTRGHEYLIERAAMENDVVHLFVVSEDRSLIPFSVRKQLVLEGSARFSNVIYHDTGSYMISNATFPSYFQKDSVSAIIGHAKLDLFIFCEIAKRLGITARYVGAEKKSLVTGIYNEIMYQKLSENGISCVEIPRLTCDGRTISASDVRLFIQQDDFNRLSALVPECTYRYLTSEEAKPVIETIKKAADVIHY